LEKLVDNRLAKEIGVSAVLLIFDDFRASEKKK